MRIERPAVRNAVIAIGTGGFVLALTAVGRTINGGLVTLIGDNALTQVNLAIATVALENAVLAFLVVVAVSFALGMVENRRDSERP